jgi:hypothetical protein
MEILNQFPVSGTCDGCKKAWRVDIPLGSKLRAICQYVEDSHRDRSPNCPRAKAILCTDRSFLDDVAYQMEYKVRTNGATLVFRMIWRDADELDLTKEERKTPMIIMGR